jgi:hypothetical protein
MDHIGSGFSDLEIRPLTFVCAEHHGTTINDVRVPRHITIRQNKALFSFDRLRAIGNGGDLADVNISLMGLKYFRFPFGEFHFGWPPLFSSVLSCPNGAILPVVFLRPLPVYDEIRGEFFDSFVRENGEAMDSSRSDWRDASHDCSHHV